MSQEKFCKECDYSYFLKGEPQTPAYMRCRAPQNLVEHIDTASFLVSGERQPTKQIVRGANCHALREERPPQIEALVCGPSGKWFKPKSPASSGVVGIGVVGSMVVGKAG
jgi:hypothetical protein